MPIIKSLKPTSNPDWVMLLVAPVINPDGSKRLFKATPYPIELLDGVEVGDDIQLEEL